MNAAHTTPTIISSDDIAKYPTQYTTGGDAMEAFCRERGITASVYRTHGNPNMPERGPMYHWSVRLHGNGNATLDTYYSTGTGHAYRHSSMKDPVPTLPTAAAVLGSLLDDADSAMTYDGAFDFAQNMGVSEEVWHTIMAQDRKVRAFLGSDYDAAVRAMRVDTGWEPEDEPESDVHERAYRELVHLGVEFIDPEGRSPEATASALFDHLARNVKRGDFIEEMGHANDEDFQRTVRDHAEFVDRVVSLVGGSPDNLDEDVMETLHIWHDAYRRELARFGPALGAKYIESWEAGDYMHAIAYLQQQLDELMDDEDADREVAEEPLFMTIGTERLDFVERSTTPGDEHDTFANERFTLHDFGPMRSCRYRLTNKATGRVQYADDAEGLYDAVAADNREGAPSPFTSSNGAVKATYTPGTDTRVPYVRIFEQEAGPAWAHRITLNADEAAELGGFLASLGLVE